MDAATLILVERVRELINALEAEEGGESKARQLSEALGGLPSR